MTSKRILLVSFGSIGQRHFRNTRTLLPDAEICLFRHRRPDDPTLPEGVHHQVYTMDDALAFAPDAVIVSSPASKHVETAEPFIAAGAHVFIEKPLESAHAKLNGFAERVVQADEFVMVGYVLRFLPMLTRIKGLIDDGALGDIRTALVQTGQYLPDWRPDSDYRDGVSARKDLGGGVLLELSHELDYASWLFGVPVSVQASCGRLSDLEIDVEDSAHVLFEYPDRRVAIQIDFLQRVAKMGLQIIGSKATLEADLINETAMVYSPDNPDGVSVDGPVSADGNEVYLRQFDVFFAKAFGDYEPKFDGSRDNTNWATIEQSAKTIEIVDAAKTASAEGRRVPLT